MIAYHLVDVDLLPVASKKPSLGLGKYSTSEIDSTAALLECLLRIDCCSHWERSFSSDSVAPC